VLIGLNNGARLDFQSPAFVHIGGETTCCRHVFAFLQWGMISGAILSVAPRKSNKPS